MNKQLVLREFLLNKDEYLSGEQISRQLGISRAAVGKIIGSLREDGFLFEGKNNKGYKLICFPEKPVKELIAELSERPDAPLFYLQECDSSNTFAKSLAYKEDIPFAVVAGEQLKGRGRYAKSFFSPEGGLYLTAVIRPKASLEQIPSLTVAAACIVCQVLEETCGVKPQIKWINDIFLNGRKLCGILCEAGICAETKTADYVAVGVGINLKGKRVQFPEEIKEIATSLENEGQNCNINLLAAELLKRLYALADRNMEALMTEILPFYKERLFMLGMEISVLKPSGSVSAVAADVDKDGRLKVCYPDGSTEWLNSGEISVKPH